MENVITLGKMKENLNELARPVMGTIFLVIISMNINRKH